MADYLARVAAAGARTTSLARPPVLGPPILPSRDRVVPAAFDRSFSATSDSLLMRAEGQAEAPQRLPSASGETHGPVSQVTEGRSAGRHSPVATPQPPREQPAIVEHGTSLELTATVEPRTAVVPVAIPHETIPCAAAAPRTVVDAAPSVPVAPSFARPGTAETPVAHTTLVLDDGPRRIEAISGERITAESDAVVEATRENRVSLDELSRPHPVVMPSAPEATLTQRIKLAPSDRAVIEPVGAMLPRSAKLRGVEVTPAPGPAPVSTDPRRLPARPPSEFVADASSYPALPFQVPAPNALVTPTSHRQPTSQPQTKITIGRLDVRVVNSPAPAPIVPRQSEPAAPLPDGPERHDLTRFLLRP